MMRPLLIIFFCVIVSNISNAEDWPQYLGKNAEGVWKESGISLNLEKHPPKLAWTREIGSGYTGPSVAEGKVFLMDRKADEYKPGQLSPGTNINFERAEIPGGERIVCLDEKSGQILWVYSYAQTYTSAFPYAIGPRSTPLYDGELVYALGAEGQLTACDVKRGFPSWTRNLIKSFKFKVPDWGTASHPILHKDLLICIAGGDGSTVVAFDKKTGSVVWKALSAKQPGYGTLVIREIHDKEVLLVWHGESVNALNPNTGDIYWTVPFQPHYGMAISPPMVIDDLIYVMGFNAKSGVIKVPSGGQSPSLLWGPSPRLGVAGVFNAPYVKDGYVYSGGRRGQFKCIKLETGERIWEDPTPLLKKDGTGKGAWQSAFTIHHQPSEKTLILNDHGELIVSKLSPDGYIEEGRMQIIEPTHLVSGRTLVWSHPAFANGRIYCRNDKEIRCWDFNVTDE